MAFAYSIAVAGAGTVSCAGTTTVTGSGTSFAFGLGSVPTGTQARVGGTITVGANTRTITAIASATSLTVDTAFPTFTAQAFTVQTGITQTGTDTMNLSLGSATGFLITNRGDLFRTFDCRGLDLTINGTLTVSSSVAQLRNDGSCNNRLTVNGSVSGGELIFNGRISTAGNGPIPYAGLDWLGTNGMGGATALVSTNATYPAKLTVIDACIRFGGDWFTVSSGNFARITTQGDECWILCAKGTGTVQARIRLNNTTPVIDLQATQTWIGTWLNFGVPQISLKGFTPIFTDGPEINLSSVSVATRINIENYDTRYIQSAYYPGSQIVPYGGAWIRFKNNLLGTNIVWQSLNVGGANFNVIEYSKQIKAISKDALGNVLNDGYFYFQPVGSNVSGIRAKGGTSDITFDLTQKNILISGGFAETEFIYAWDYANTTGLKSTPKFFCSGQTKGAETHPSFLSRYGYDKQPITLTLSGNNTFEVSASHASLPTSDKVIATAAAISGIAFNFSTKVMTITGNLTYQQIYDAYQYALNITANLFQANDCLTTDSIFNYVGWTINLGAGVTISNPSGSFTTLKANTISIESGSLITSTYADSTGVYAKLLVNGLSTNMVAKLITGSTVLSSIVSTGTSGFLDYFIPTGSTSISATLYVERATGQTNGYNLYTNTLTLGDTGATTTAIMAIDTFYGRSAGQADRSNVSVTWNSTTGAPTITLSGDADVKSVYDVVLESHATTANITFNRPTTTDGFTYQFTNAIFTGTGKMTGSKQFFTTGGVSINYDLILNYLNTLNFLPNSWIKVIKSSDNSVLSPFALNVAGKLELNMGTGIDYKVFLKKDGYKPLVEEINSGTGQALTLDQKAQAFYNATTNISTLIPLLDVTNTSGILSIVSVGEMRATSLEVCAIIDHLQKDEDYADVALFAETGDIWEIISQYQNTPDPTYIKIERESSLTNTELTIWDTYFTTSSTDVPDEDITPIQASTGLWVMSNRSAVGEVTVKNEQAVAISQNASEYVWSKILENGKTANRNVSQSNNFDAITSIEVQKTN
jgi:hypothetical protein